MRIISADLKEPCSVEELRGGDPRLVDNLLDLTEWLAGTVVVASGPSGKELLLESSKLDSVGNHNLVHLLLALGVGSGLGLNGTLIGLGVSNSLVLGVRLAGGEVNVPVLLVLLDTGNELLEVVLLELGNQIGLGIGHLLVSNEALLDESLLSSLSVGVSLLPSLENTSPEFDGSVGGNSAVHKGLAGHLDHAHVVSWFLKNNYKSDASKILLFISRSLISTQT